MLSVKKETTCKHKIVKDYIDIDLEKSQIIYYCKRCDKIFPTPQKTTLQKSYEKTSTCLQ